MILLPVGRARSTDDDLEVMGRIHAMEVRGVIPLESGTPTPVRISIS
jgi:hypothetical protein